MKTEKFWCLVALLVLGSIFLVLESVFVDFVLFLLCQCGAVLAFGIVLIEAGWYQSQGKDVLFPEDGICPRCKDMKGEMCPQCLEEMQEAFGGPEDWSSEEAEAHYEKVDNLNK